MVDHRGDRDGLPSRRIAGGQVVRCEPAEARAVGARGRGRREKNQTVATVASITRLATVLDMAKVDRARREYPPSAFVFGALGEQVANPKKAWETCVLRAHGHEPAWIRRGTLSEASSTALAAIDLHFHDLRHGAGCRWLEQGWPIHHVQEMLGHSNPSQTRTYLHASELGLQESTRRFDAQRGKFEAKEAQKEHPPLSHAQEGKGEKGTLH